MIHQVIISSLNAAELRTTNSLERYLIIFRTGKVLIKCMHFHFINFSPILFVFLLLDLQRIINGYFTFDRMIQGSGLSGPIPSGISLLRNLNDLYV